MVVAVALALGGAALVHVLNASLEHNRRSVAVSQAVDIANLAASGHLPAILASPNEDSTLSQVVDKNNQVVAASGNIIGEPPVAPFSEQPSVTHVTTLAADNGGPSLLIALGGRLGGRPVTVFSAVSLQATNAAMQTVIAGLVVGLPLLLALVAATTWVIVGRTLRPIELIRSEVAEITSQDLHRRVPQPVVDDEVGHLAATMNSMLDRLERSSEQQRRFVADASHELRSPLAAIRAELEVGLARGAATDWPATAADLLLDEARIEHLVSSLLVLARLEADRRPPLIQPVDLSSLVREHLQTTTKRDDVTVRADIVDGVHALIDAPQAHQVVTNLVDNAQRHARSQVIVTVAPHDHGTVSLVVADDGSGVAPSDRETVFERFTRLDECGAGLGLAIVRDIVFRHQGTVAFTDSVVGARVVVTLRSATAKQAVN